MFKLLKTFQIVYEQMNFSKAATCLYISQPAVSNQIKQLEEELGCSLFLRNGRQDVVPTRQAEVLYNRLLNLADDWQETLKLFIRRDYLKKLAELLRLILLQFIICRN